MSEEQQLSAGSRDAVVARVAEAMRRVNKETSGLSFAELLNEMARVAVDTIMSALAQGEQMREVLLRAQIDLKAAAEYVEAHENTPAYGLRQTLAKVNDLLAAQPLADAVEPTLQEIVHDRMKAAAASAGHHPDSSAATEVVAWQARWPGEDWHQLNDFDPETLRRVKNSGRELRPLYAVEPQSTPARTEITKEMALAGQKALAAVADRMDEARRLATSSVDLWQRIGHEPANEIYAAMVAASLTRPNKPQEAWRPAVQALVSECVNPGDGAPFERGEWPALDAVRDILAISRPQSPPTHGGPHEPDQT